MVTTCISCGRTIPTGSTMCRGCRPPTTSRQARSRAAWTRLSRKVRAAGVCDYCRRPFPPEALEADHIVPLTVAPHLAYAEANIVALCVDCHRAKTRHDEYERRAALGEM